MNRETHNSMNDTIRFGDFAEVNPRVKLEKGKEYPYIEMADINPGNAFVFPQEERVYKGGGSRFQSGDILFARITPCLENGKIVQFRHTSNQQCFGSTEFFVFRGKPNISDSTYILYLALSPIIRDPAVKSMSGASGRQRAALSSVEDISIPFLPLQTQYKIATILSTYDDLIENNTHRIKILEDMAQTLYQEWFVHYRFPGHENVSMVESELGPIPQGWQIKKLADLVLTQYGYTESATEDEVGPKFVRGKDINKTTYIDWEAVPFCPIDAKKHANYQLNVGDILVIRMADPGKVAIIEKDINAVFASYLIRLKLRSTFLSPYYLFYALLDARYQNYVDGASTGTTRKSASAGVITDFGLVIPTQDIRKSFEELITSLRKALNNLLEKNANLRQTRDLLLPKLISGEIDVSELDIDTNEIQPKKGGTYIPYSLTERLHSDKKILGGKPVIRGTRLSVELILDLLEQGWSEENILENYPGITHEDIKACQEYQKR